VIDYGFINFDDYPYVLKNDHIKNGFSLESVKGAFTKTGPPYWHPITWLSHMLDTEVYGLAPFGHHLTNLLFHIANTLLLFGVLLKMTGAVLRSGLVAVLFALHPLNVESVAWIAERKNVLSAFFWFLTIWAYVDYAKKKKIGTYLLVVLFLTLGLMSKPTLVTLPFVLILLDFWPLKRWSRKDVEIGARSCKTQMPASLCVEKIPLFILAAGGSSITYIAQKDVGAMRFASEFSLYGHTSNAFVSYVEYLRNIVWPHELSIFYPHPGNELPFWKVILCAFFLIGLTTWVVKNIPRAPYLAVGWFWYLGSLVPIIGIVQVGAQAMADRFVYIPMIGIFIMIAWGLGNLLEKREQKFLYILTPVIALVLIILTWKQLSYWENSITLFTRVIELNDNSPPKSIVAAYHSLAGSLEKENRTKEALHFARAGLSIDANYLPLIEGMGVLLYEERELEEAEIYFRKAVKLNPRSFKNNHNLALFLEKTGR